MDDEHVEKHRNDTVFLLRTIEQPNVSSQRSVVVTIRVKPSFPNMTHMCSDDVTFMATGCYTSIVPEIVM